MTGKTIEIVPEGVEQQMPSSVLALYDMSWQEYLKRKNYNKDINKMCGLCIEKQKAEHGEITIKCSGLKKLESMAPPDVLYAFEDHEVQKLKELVDPYEWADKHLDIHQEDPTKRIFSRRWYQEQFVSCSAKRKTIRCGRRTGKSYGLALDCTHRLVNTSNYRIIVVTPFLTQAKELADNVRKMLRNLSEDVGTWDELVDRSVTSPVHEIKLRNGSTFKAFTAGGSDAGAVRGQGADLIILDEADFLSQEAFNSVSAILADTPTTELICTSTPYGENILYKLSHSPEYKEFHFPTFCLPHYDDDLDNDFRSSTDVAGYVQEIMGEWGIASNAVFQGEFIEAGRQKLEVKADDFIVNRKKYILSLGCDWNGDKVGTRIVITGLNKETGEISTARMDNVVKEGWTQAAAVQKIIELNRAYDLDHMYVDEGFGESNVQQLKLHAVNNYGKLPYDHPDLKLDEVVAVNFASTLELRDVVTGEIRKKYYKNFMVETVNRALESGVLNLSGHVNKPIVEQMKNYIVKSTTSNGRKIYEAKSSEIGDHDLDAYMLSIMALYLEHSSILDARTPSAVQILPVERSINQGYNEASTIVKRPGDEELSQMTSGLFHSYKSHMPRVGRAEALKSGSRTSNMISRLGGSQRTNLGSRSRFLTGR